MIKRIYNRLFKHPESLTDVQRTALFVEMSERLQRRLTGKEVEPLDQMINRVLRRG